MTTLRVITDPALAEVPDESGRYTVELTRALIATAPAGCDVEGIVAAHSAEDDARLTARLPELARVTSLQLGRRELSIAWQMGAKVPALGGMVHSPSLLAPLRKHEGQGLDQVVVTVHDTAAWTTERMPRTDALWNRRLLKRVRDHADAVVVPTHAVARSLADVADLGDRIRVIPPAVSADFTPPDDGDSRARTLALPERYVLAVSDVQPRKGLKFLLTAMSRPLTSDLPLVVVIPAADAMHVHELVMQAGLAEQRVTVLSDLTTADLALVVQRASVLVAPSLESGFGLPIVEAFSLGTPVVHSDAPALLEVASDASIVVERKPEDGFGVRLSEAIGRILDDDGLARRLRVLGEDRARAYSWRDSADRVWQLHADL